MLLAQQAHMNAVFFCMLKNVSTPTRQTNLKKEKKYKLNNMTP